MSYDYPVNQTEEHWEGLRQMGKPLFSIHHFGRGDFAAIASYRKLEVLLLVRYTILAIILQRLGITRNEAYGKDYVFAIRHEA